MKIDLHIHSKDCSDGRMTLEEIFEEASHRHVDLISITDHDSTDCQEPAKTLAHQYKIRYIYGLELNVSFSHPDYRNAKPISLDFLAYQYDIHHPPLVEKLSQLRAYRRKRAEQILEKINQALLEEDLGKFTQEDIANYMVKKGIVRNKQEAFDRYLINCNVPKMPLSLSEASRLVKGAGGKLMLAHPNDPNGTSLVSFTTSLDKQQKVIRESMLSHIDGIECWHPRHDPETVQSYLAFAQSEGLMVTGGSDCHQQPIVLGTVPVPPYVAEQFNFE
jgi:predicted metal-dependent phosphoesterase TrpH